MSSDVHGIEEDRSVLRFPFKDKLWLELRSDTVHPQAQKITLAVNIPVNGMEVQQTFPLSDKNQRHLVQWLVRQLGEVPPIDAHHHHPRAPHAHDDD
jgi:hypothetical protein